MSVQATLVAETIDHRNQSWDYNAILRVGRGTHVLKIHVRTSNSREQSDNYLAVWTAAGWERFCSLATSAWWSSAPGYTKRELEPRDWRLFRSVREDLLWQFSAAMYGNQDGVKVDE